MTLLDIVEVAYLSTFTTKCDLARQYADLVAEAALKGYITTLRGPDDFGGIWRVTPEGAEIIMQWWNGGSYRV